MLWTRLHLAGLKQRLRGRVRRAQAMIESAIVIPLMTFLILGVLQLAMIQHARIMTEYAAFNAARAGIVWNADPWIMENAAIVSLMPTYENVAKDAGMRAILLKQHYTALGQRGRILPTDGVKTFIMRLRERGIPQDQVDFLVRKNPARVLGLDPW